MEAVLLIGVQGAGKSSFYSAQLADTHVRVNLDMLKTRHRERRLIETCLETQQPFAVDNTNLQIRDRGRYVPLAREAGFRVVGYYLASAIADCLERNSQRHGKTRVPDQAVLAGHRKLELPSMSEGFDKLFYVRIGPDSEFQIEGWQNEV